MRNYKKFIKETGFPKGFKDENVGLSQKSALVIINLGSANGTDVLAFATKIKQEVYNTFQVILS